MMPYQMTDDAENALVTALAALQAEIPSVRKGETAEVPTKAGGKYSYTYADLADVTAAILPRLGALGLAYVARPDFTSSGAYVLDCSLRHQEGGRISARWPLPNPLDKSPQEVGAAITYGRRYVLCSLTGLAPGGDDDDASYTRTPVRTTRARPITEVRERQARGTAQTTDPWPDDRPDVADDRPDVAEAETPPVRQRSEAQRANDRVRAATPPGLRTPERQDDRHALYALAARAWGAGTTTLTGEALKDYQRWARMVDNGAITLDRHDDETPPWARIVDGDGVELQRITSDLPSDNPSSPDPTDPADTASPGSAGTDGDTGTPSMVDEAQS